MINFIGNNKGVLFSSYYCSYFSNKNFFRSFSTKREKKSSIKPKRIWINFDVFFNDDIEKFIQEIFFSNKVYKNVDYSLIFKIRKDDLFLSIGNKQKHFSFESKNDVEFIKLFNLIRDRLYKVFEDYKVELDYSIDAVLVEFWEVKIDDKIKISNLDIVKHDNSDFDVTGFKRELDLFGNNLFNIKGAPLNAKIINGKLVISNTFDLENLDMFLDRFNENITDINYRINELSEFFLVYRNNRAYIIILDRLSLNIVEKRSFNFYGNFLSKIKDTINSEGELIREDRNTTIVLKNDTIISLERKISFDSIINDIKVKEKDKETSWLPNRHIGTLDLETYEVDGQGKCYSLGFYCPSVDEECKTFYIDKDLDSISLIIKCINEMLEPKYNNITFYVHNFGKFDAAFIVKALVLYNKEKDKKDRFLLDITTRNSDILKLVIKQKKNKKFRSIIIKDSFAILPSDLRTLCKNYNVDTKKGYFPYNFCTKNTLYYVGQTPNINYYNDITQEIYNTLIKDEWSLQEECLRYLKDDLVSLYEVLIKVNKTIHSLFDIQMTNCLTISGISIRYFLNKFYDKNKNPLPLILNRGVWENIHKAYYGGRVEVFNPIFISNKENNFKKLYYYDVNSLYPYSSLNRVPSLNCKYIENFGLKKKIENSFGFFFCWIKSKAGYLGLLPKRTDTCLIFPNGEWYGWYFSEELKFAKKHGYEIEIIKGYEFDYVENVFKDFVNSVYILKANAKNETERNVAKLILNSLIGRFGMDFLKSITKLVDGKTHNILNITRVIRNTIEMEEDLFLDTFKPGIDKEVCEDFGIDFIKALNIESIDEKTNTKTFKSVSISTASAVIAYARIHMLELMLYILENGGKIYYTDTDSIVTDLKLPENFVHKTELGKLKLEHTILEGYFVSDKTYAFINEKGKLIKKAKGVDSKKLSLDDYKKMYKLETIQNAVKKDSIRNYETGSVVIRTKNNIKLNVNNYTKRERVLIDGVWISTKPVIINEKIIINYEQFIELFYNKKYIFGEYNYNSNSTTQFIIINFNKCYNLNYIYYKLKQINDSLSFIKYQLNNCTDLWFPRPLSIILIIENKFIDDITNKIEKDKIYKKDKNITGGIVTLVLDINKNLIKECLSLKEASKFTGINDKTLKRSYLNKDKLYNDKFYFVNKNIHAIPSDSIVAVSLDTSITEFKNKSQPILILTKNRKVKTTFVSIREAGRFYDINESVIRKTYLNKDKLFKNKYYIVRDINQSNKRSFSTKTYNINRLGLDFKRLYTTKCNTNQNIIKKLVDSPISKPFLDVKFLAPILYTPNILLHLKQCEMILSKIPDNNKVKKYLINEMNSKIKVVAKEHEQTDIILNKYFQKEKSAKKLDIIRNDFSYNSNLILSSEYVFLYSRFYINKLKEHCNLRKNKNKKIAKQFKLKNTKNKSYNKSGKLLDGSLWNLNTYYYNRNLKTKYSSSAMKFSKYMDTLCCCYIIIFNNNLYYYIGSSINILDRVKNHNSNIENIIYELLYNLGLSSENYCKCKPDANKLWYNFIESEIKYNEELNYKIIPIYFSTNYLNKFQLLHPKYKLSKGEWIILKYITDLTIKILEQSLIYKFQPKLNILENVYIQYYSWNDSYLNEITNDKYLSKIYGKTNKYLILIHKLNYKKEFIYGVNRDISNNREYIIIGPYTEYYIKNKYNLNINEVIENNKKLHYYKGCKLKYKQPMILEII